MMQLDSKRKLYLTYKGTVAGDTRQAPSTSWQLIPPGLRGISSETVRNT